MLITPKLEGIEGLAKNLGLNASLHSLPGDTSFKSVTLDPIRTDPRWDPLMDLNDAELRTTFFIDEHGVVYGEGLKNLVFDLIFPGMEFEQFPNFNLRNGEVWDFPRDMGEGASYGHSYGVCDKAEQVLEKYKSVVENPDVEVVITMLPVFKKNQPEHGGWRWHKWGSYIGEHTPTAEYLYDESAIDHVFCYHIYLREA